MFGADDFLPCLTWVLLRSDVFTLQLDTDYMMELLDPTQLQGEGTADLIKHNLDRLYYFLWSHSLSPALLCCDWLVPGVLESFSQWMIGSVTGPLTRGHILFILWETLTFFFELLFSVSVWLGWGYKTTASGLGKDHSLGWNRPFTTRIKASSTSQSQHSRVERSVYHNVKEKMLN